MHRQVLQVLVGLFSLTSAFAQDEAVAIKNGFLTGQDYLESSELKQRAYVMGLVDGLFVSPILGAPKRRLAPFERCIEGMTDTQVAAILLKFLRDNPGRWHQSAHVSFYTAMKENCSIR